MKVKEYFQLAQLGKYSDVTFIKARARKDANTPFHHAEYQTTPICPVIEWCDSKLMSYIVLNNKQAPIDWLSGAKWLHNFNCGNLHSLLIISEEDLKTLYGEKQAQSMEKYIDDEIKKSLGL